MVPAPGLCIGIDDVIWHIIFLSQTCFYYDLQGYILAPFLVLVARVVPCWTLPRALFFRHEDRPPRTALMPVRPVQTLIS